MIVWFLLCKYKLVLTLALVSLLHASINQNLRIECGKINYCRSVDYSNYCKNLTACGKIFTIFYALIGVGIIAFFANLLIRNAALKRELRRTKRKLTWNQPWTVFCSCWYAPSLLLPSTPPLWTYQYRRWSSICIRQWRECRMP